MNPTYNSFRPGKVWLDTEGKRIQAHGGSIITVGDTFYWYGENKEKTLPGSNIWHWGVRLYSSKDLYNWKDEGLIMPPSEDESNPLHPSQYMDRPHILYNEKTQRFVMWLKIMDNKNLPNQTMAVAVSDTIFGPFTLISHKTILGISSGDFDLVCDPLTQKAYIYFDRVHDYGVTVLNDYNPHGRLICAELNEDYTDVTGVYDKVWYSERRREAPAFFRRNGKAYLATSGTTGYIPNPTEVAVADDCRGPFTVLGALHVNDTENLSFRSQISSVFKHPQKKDLYIALADRWLINLPEDMPNNFYDISCSHNDPHRQPIAPYSVLTYVRSFNKPDVRNISLADYVWLPIVFEGDRPYVHWHDEWRIEDFD